MSKTEKLGVVGLVEARAQKIRDIARENVVPYAAAIAQEMQFLKMSGYEGGSLEIDKVIAELFELDTEYREFQSKYKIHIEEKESYNFSEIIPLVKNGKWASRYKREYGNSEKVKWYDMSREQVLLEIGRRIKGFDEKGQIIHRSCKYSTDQLVEMSETIVSRIEEVIAKRREIVKILQEFDVYTEGLFVEDGKIRTAQYKQEVAKWEDDNRQRAAEHESVVVVAVGEAKHTRLKELNEELLKKGGKSTKKLPDELAESIEQSVRTRMPYVEENNRPVKIATSPRSRAKSMSLVNFGYTKAEDDKFYLWEQLKEMK